ncbi:glycosyl-4,4'-diaponeurosporenoate acyltransferase [Bacillus mangrovi]|uniref:Glycosyl-4,4'-diaponeurosporenoate acyltransferase n=1 Tax=Metabacillus mangrovi TaxID=1491830 RepID=A0A7X2S4A9_9BACI|nr:glycosyl-4,4'-diaponeurosporenoate acyltransferase [Metabacillus mangrovi]MTH53152.1 glycosyl-4,4'-diaponeurosporenoate acyltransferase [Metabacillus mangrovi]
MSQAVQIALNIVWLAAFPVALSWMLSKFSPEAFKGPSFLFRQRRWEKEGRIYEKAGIKRWKDRLPEAGGWFRNGFPKNKLAGSKSTLLNRFILETNRGETAHWLQIFSASAFFLWNEPFTACIFMLYAILFNLPFIAVQRYNRFRLIRTLEKRKTKERTPITYRKARDHE